MAPALAVFSFGKDISEKIFLSVHSTSLSTFAGKIYRCLAQQIEFGRVGIGRAEIGPVAVGSGKVPILHWVD